MARVAGALDLKFLGSPEVFLNDQPLKFSTRKALALLAYLVVEGGAHPRPKLLAIFWPESEIRLAQSALRNTLARLKDALGGVDEPLRLAGDRVGFNFSIPINLDLDLVRQAIAGPQPGQVALPAVALLERAAQVSRGPFMDGFSLPDAPAFDEWLAIQRAAWTRRQNRVYDRLSLHQLENHLIQPALETVSRWLMLDRLNETAYQRLMRLHFLNNDRNAALQAYQTCRDLLAQELEVEPSPETQDVLTYICAGPPPVPVVDSQARVREPFHIPFVGRSNEYQELIRSFHQAQKGMAQVVVVSGEAGIGKTRLADEFLKWAGSAGADILCGRAFETSKRLPYQPIVDALRERMERENAPDDLLDDAWLVELTRILPELRERYPDLGAVSDDPLTVRARLFEAIARFAISLSSRQTLVWLLDDLHWSDQETFQLLHYLARAWRTHRAPVLLLILVSGEALAHESTLRKWMSSLTHDIQVTHLTLAALDADDLQQLVSALAGENAPGSSELAAWLTAETAGQPFFLAETLSALAGSGALEPLATLARLKSGGLQSPAPAIRELILARLAWLSQPALAILAAAAVLGRHSSFIHLCQVAGVDEQNGLNALDELLSARLMRETRNQDSPYTIAHDHIQAVVSANLSEARRQAFHRRALAALSEAQTPYAELAHHALAAQEWRLAFTYSLEAGDEALALCAGPDAIAHYQAALALLKEKKVAADPVACQQLYQHLEQAHELE